jgi:hypothetical protein
VLVCSNFHWLADEGAWDGGLMRIADGDNTIPEDDNQEMLLNLAASAATFRMANASYSA